VESAATSTKDELRARVLAARREVGSGLRKRAATRLTRAVLDLPDVVAARCVAAYYSIGTEPSTAEILAGLRSRNVRVMLPVLRDDLDLDWAIYVDSYPMTQSLRGLWTPGGPRLGVDAVRQADVVVVPALAVGGDGTRLGRGGGSYDRALTRLPAGRPVIALLYDGELLRSVPSEAHDRPVDVAVLPSGVHRLGLPGRGTPR